MKNLIIKGVECRLNENGVAELSLEHVARGLGFTETAASGNETVRWRTVRSYLQEFNVIATSCDGFPSTSRGNDLPDFIQENIFYKLCFKAKNEIAKDFQDLVTDEILPSIRKHGGYLTPQKLEEALLNPDTLIHLGNILKEERARRIEAESVMYQQQEVIEIKNSEIKELFPDAQYTRDTLKSVNTFTTTQIAKDLGMSAEALNKKLHNLGIQYKVNGQWVLYAKYQDKEYTKTNTYTEVINGVSKTYHSTVWTELGRKFIIKLIKNNQAA